MSVITAILVGSLAQAGTPASAAVPPAKPVYCCPHFGSLIGRAGDLDGDSKPDLVVGDPGHPYGSAAAELWFLSGHDGRVLRRVECPPSEYPADVRSEFELDGGSDLDADGTPDVVLGLRPMNGPGEGALWAISGRSGAILHQQRIDSRGLGSTGWLRLLADQDSDGIAEIGVLCPSQARGKGHILVLSGRSGARLHSVSIGQPHGSLVASFVEVSGSGAGAFAVLLDAADWKYGAHARTNPNAGGPPAAARSALRMLSRDGRSVAWERELSGPHDWLNAATASLGDLDADGVSELLIGHEQVVDVVSGSTGEGRFHFEMKDRQSECGLGCALAGPGDLDSDGVPDMVIAESDPFLFEGMVQARSGKSGEVLWEVRGSFDDDVRHLGHQLAVAGDLDGDGASDLVLGTNEGLETAPGLAQVRSGRSGRLLFQFRRQDDTVVVERSGASASARR